VKENKMKNAVARLAYTRNIEAEYKDEVAAAEAELKESGTWRYLEQRREYLKTAKADVTDAEASVRRAAVETFRKTGNTKPHPAVKVKIYVLLDYEPADALDYAREHLPAALKLDKRTFERAAKVVVMDFVATRQEPRATIARDLSEYLPTGDT